MCGFPVFLCALVLSVRPDSTSWFKALGNTLNSVYSIQNIMSNYTLFTAGSIHQGHEGFSDRSRGKQCSFMSLSALLCA